MDLPGKKFSQIPVAGGSPALTDTVLGVDAGNTDVRHTWSQVQKTIGGGSGSGLTALTANTTFYVTLNGSDTTGTGTQANPWATPNYAVNWIAGNIFANGFSVFVQVGIPGTPGQIFNLTAPLFLPAIAGCNGSYRELTKGGPAAVLIGDNTTPSNIRLVYNDSYYCVVNLSQGATVWTLTGFDINSSTLGIFVEIGMLALGNLVFSGGYQYDCIIIYNHGFVVGLNYANWTIDTPTCSTFLFLDRYSAFNAGAATITFAQNPTTFSNATVYVYEVSHASFYQVTFVNPSYASGIQFFITNGSFLDATLSNTPTKATWPGASGTGVIDTTSVFFGTDPIPQITAPATVAFADLPSIPTAGQQLNISNANVNTWGASVTGTGANNVLARWNGAAWTVIGI